MEIQEILEAFRVNDGVYKRKYVDEALKRKDEIIPHLISILENIVTDPKPYIENDYFDHLYAVILLGYFKTHQAHSVIIDLLSMPGEIPQQIFGDIITENFPVILFQTCGGKLDRIKSLILNKEANDFCRGSALRTMVYAVVDGTVTREETLDFFGSLFTGKEAKEDSTFWDLLANCVYDLYPEELMPVIQKAYQDDLIDSWAIGIEDFEECLQHGKKATFERIRMEMQHGMPAEVHKYMSWWACFRTSEESTIPFDSKPNITATPSTKKSNEKKGKKMAKASKKRNRR
jgi:hypothetical protein